MITGFHKCTDSRLEESACIVTLDSQPPESREIQCLLFVSRPVRGVHVEFCGITCSHSVRPLLVLCTELWNPVAVPVPGTVLVPLGSKCQEDRLRPVFQAQCSEVLIFRSIKASILLWKLANAPEAVDHL